MSLFGKMFEKKICSVCGDEIKLLGNRKLEDGNLCKNCAGKLSPWFSDRRSSTVEEIREQLAYREAIREAVAAFHITRSFGTGTKLLLDEDAGKFMITRARDLREANPDVLDLSQITGCDVDVDESKSEVRTKDPEGKSVSYNPPRYTFRYNFNMVVRVSHPWFDTMRFQLNPSGIEINPNAPVPVSRRPNPAVNREYREYLAMAREIRETRVKAREYAREQAAEAAAPKTAVTWPFCGASTIPDANGCCEYCGSALLS